MSNPALNYRLRQFITDFAELLTKESAEPIVLEQGSQLLKQLIEHDDWLPDAFAQPHPDRYQQYLLHVDSAQRFSIVSFVWGAGQKTPIHDHRTWGLIGMLRGSELSQHYQRSVNQSLIPIGPAHQLQVGQVETVSPSTQDIHQVSNAYSDQTSISIHVYGANIGAVKRATYQPDGTEKSFISGYSNTLLPNIWDLSKEPATS
ncbi:cysteine dioxygenase family protein [Aquirhabdus parva]|uniref:Cysteine dioxygenase n=1 Tax=Aquirhabdus parva TaxID=2283318 RepID=A0A345P5L4_9GAMM|nr:cysteine dioxygenase [Aquirhabdus parva]AXI02573.1 cysteine dioxygenase [Aquirhabdus parva]